jgi:hypothetical protein
MSHPPICRAWELWKNPIFLRYCRARLRPTALSVACLLTVMIAGFMFQMIRTLSENNRLNLSDSDVERTPLIALLILQSVILFVLGTAQASGGMTAERDEGVIDYQRLLPMTPAAKVLGYLFGLPIREYAMFACTLPFVIWGMWKGDVPSHTWISLYGVMASTTILYHLTGLLTGTIVKNRRWAFLTSIGLIFALYTVIPQAAKFGLVFFKYLTVTPTVEESMRFLTPSTIGDTLETARRLLSQAKFFNLDFSEAVFTYFSQSCLIITFFVMLCRRWKDSESHLLGKIWAVGFYTWVQILLLGNALPLIDSGKLFPTQQMSRFYYLMQGKAWEPASWEAMAMILAYGLISLLFLWVLSSIITPTFGTQINGWRRANKLGRTRLPKLADESNSTGFVLIMAIIGGAGWFAFTYMIVESRWFPGHFVAPSMIGYFILAMVTCALLHHILLEAKGGRVVFLALIFILVLPLMVASILLGASDSNPSNRLPSIAVWIGGISPLSLPALCAANHLSIAQFPVSVSRAIPAAYIFWQAVYLITVISLIKTLWRSRKATKNLV